MFDSQLAKAFCRKQDEIDDQCCVELQLSIRITLGWLVSMFEEVPGILQAMLPIAMKLLLDDWTVEKQLFASRSFVEIMNDLMS